MLTIYNTSQFEINGKDEYGLIKLKIYWPKLNLINVRLNKQLKNYKRVYNLFTLNGAIC